MTTSLRKIVLPDPRIPEASSYDSFATSLDRSWRTQMNVIRVKNEDAGYHC